jgi:predicted amidohydrolase
MFDIDIPGKAQFRESATTAPGRDPIVVETELARIGLSICYDLRFPELYREMALRRGAELLLVPSAFTAHTGAAHWHTLLRARAVENQCFVLAAAQSGQHNPKRASYGHTLIYDPWGDLLGELASGVGLVTANIELDRLDETRRQLPCLEHVVL